MRSLLTQIGFIEKYGKAKRGEDVSETTLKTTVNERPKKTRKMKKAAVAKEETKEETPESKEPEQSDEAPAEEQS